MDYFVTRVFTSENTGAAVYVFSDDHCPPHVHARHRGDGWIARVSFSYVDSEVGLMSVAPLKNTPLRRVLNILLDDVAAVLPFCRRAWWLTARTTCLANQWVVAGEDGKIQLSSAHTPYARQIADASYDPDRESLMVAFGNGTHLNVSAR